MYETPTNEKHFCLLICHPFPLHQCLPSLITKRSTDSSDLRPPVTFIHPLHSLRTLRYLRQVSYSAPNPLHRASHLNMGEGIFRQKLRFLRRKRPPPPNPYIFLNDAPRAPAIPLPERISDASSADMEHLFENPLYELRSSKASQDNVCLVCLDNIPQGTTRIRLPCNHTLWHRHCLEEWLRRSPRCPLCSKHVPTTRSSKSSFAGEWRLWERRVHLHEIRRERESRERVTSLSSRDLNWLMYERRLSSASRPNQPQPRRFARSLTTRR